MNTSGIGLDGLRVLTDGLDHPEGVTLGPDGLLYAGGEAGQIYRIDPGSGEASEITCIGGFFLGITLDADGRIYCCDIKRRAVVRFDPHTNKMEEWFRGTHQRQLVNPNMVVFDAVGHAYVTDSGHWLKNDGCIFNIAPGEPARVWTVTSHNFPNGACLDVDGRALLVAESTSDPCLVRIPINGDGTAGPRRIVARLAGTVPDGTSLDSEGNAYVTCYRPDRIVRVTPRGRVEVLAEDPLGTLLAAPTNCAFAGPRLRTCVIANLGRWHLAAVDFGVAGLSLRYPKLPDQVE